MHHLARERRIKSTLVGLGGSGEKRKISLKGRGSQRVVQRTATLWGERKNVPAKSTKGDGSPRSAMGGENMNRFYVASKRENFCKGGDLEGGGGNSSE